MELRVLRYFLAIAQTRNITRAAKELLVAQPTLSKQLADLETELGVQLFIRGHRQLTLTPEGEYLRERAQDIVKLTDQTTHNIQRNELINGELTIGAGEGISMQRISNILIQMIKDYPHVRLHLVSGNADEMEAQLARGTIDFAVLMGTRPLDNYNFLLLPEVNVWGVLMPKNVPLTKHAAIAPSDLIDLPLLLSQQALQEHRFQNWWGNLGDKMNICGTFTLVFNAELLVQNGTAYMITFDHLLVNPQSKNLVFRPLKPKLSEPSAIIWPKNRLQSTVAQTFIQRLKASLT